MTRTRNDIPKAMMAAVLALLIAAAGIVTLLPHHLHHTALHRICFALADTGCPADTPCGGCEDHGLDINGCNYRQPGLRADSQQEVPDVPMLPAMALCGLTSIPETAETDLLCRPRGDSRTAASQPPCLAACGLRAPPAGK